MQSIAVIGGGVTGVTTAYALVNRGFSVTLFERNRYVAMETSFANGGQLSASNAEVWNHWPTIVKGLKWMFRPDAPLLVNPKPSWHKLSWFAEFIAAIPRYAENTTATAALAIEARRYLFDWAEREGIAFDPEHRGILHVYRHRAGFDHAAAVTKLLQRAGLERHAVGPAEMRDIEPNLNGDYYGGFYTPTDATGDIHKFTTGLADAAARRGVSMRYGCPIDALSADSQGVRIATDQGHESFDGVVVCAGVGSRDLAARLGDRVNVYPVKGYSITVELDDEASRQAAPRMSLLDDETKLVSSRLGDGRLRVAGSAEFNGYNYDIRADRIRPLVDWVAQCFPGVSTRKATPWAGLRPMMPDMMPKVGPGRSPGVFYNTGHGHLGWTLSAVTADQIATIIAQAAEKANGAAALQ